MKTEQKNYTLPIIVMFALFFMIAFVTNFAGSMGVIVKNQFHASNALSQLGTLANFIAYACMGIPAGIILKRKGYKFTSLAAVTVGFVGVGIQFLSGYVESFGVYVLGAFVAGFSMCMLNIVVNPMLNTLGGGGNKGNQLIQFGGSCNSIGGTIAPVLLGYLIGGSAETATVSDAAPAMIIAMAIFALAAVIIGLVRIPEPHIETAEERAARKAGNKVKDKYGPLSFRHFVLGAVAIFFYVGIEVGIPGTLNFYLADQSANGAGVEGAASTIAGAIVAIYWLLMLVGRFCSSIISGAVSTRAQIITVSTVAIALVVAAIVIPKTVTLPVPEFIYAGGAQVPVSAFLLVICGLCTSVMWGGIFNLAVEGLGKYTAQASGIFMMMVVGGGIMPLIQSYIAGVAGYMASYWLIVAMLAYLLFYGVSGSKNVNTDIPVDDAVEDAL